MKILILLIAGLCLCASAAAQTTDIINAEAAADNPDISNPDKLPLYVLIVRKRVTILDTAYEIDPRVINGIYFLSDKQKSVNKFGDKGKNGVVFITTRKEYLARFLKMMGIRYNYNEKDPYTQKGSQIYQ